MFFNRNSYITKNRKQTIKAISDYQENAYIRALERIANAIKNDQKLTEKQHMVPDFILKRIAAENPANAKKEKGLLLREHTIEFDPTTKKIGDFIPQKTLVSPADYSTRYIVYNSNLLEHTSLMEYMFSIVEGDAARLIDARIAVEYDLTTKQTIDPYYYSLPQLRVAPSSLESRIILATFFASQHLRSIHREGALKSLGNKYGLDGLDFPSLIKELLKQLSIETYSRQWVWVRVPKHEMIISELGLISTSTCTINPHTREPAAALLMPISRHDFIYFNELPDSHYIHDDQLVYSDSSMLYEWYFWSKMEQFCKLEIETIGGKDRISFVSNSKATFRLKEIHSTIGCCIGCIFRGIRLVRTKELIIFWQRSIRRK